MVEIWTYEERAHAVGGLDLTGFDVEATDGQLGRVVRFHDEPSASYLVIDPGVTTTPGRSVVLPAGVIDTVDVDGRRVRVDVSTDTIRNAPTFRPEELEDATLRERVTSHYGREPRTPTPERPSRPTPAPKRRKPATIGRVASRGVAASDEPTKAELYEEAKHVGLEGRSKMNKAQLKRALERRR